MILYLKEYIKVPKTEVNLFFKIKNDLKTKKKEYKLLYLKELMLKIITNFFKTF